MAELTLGQCAKLTGKGKTTLSRAIANGRLSATRRSDGSYLVEVSELGRVYKLKNATPSATPVVHHATPSGAPDATGGVAPRLRELEAQIEGLKALNEELRQARDDWKGQATRLALADHRDRRPWWRRLAG